MSKKDFSQDSTDVFNQMFSAETIKSVENNNLPKEEKTKKVEKPVKEIKNKSSVKPTKIKEEEIVPVDKEKTEETNNKQQKIFDKKYRYSFYAEPILNEYLSNITWIKRIKNVPPYLNSLIRADLLDLLNLPKDSSDEELMEKWEIYKKENNL